MPQKCTINVYFYDRPDRRYDRAEHLEKNDTFVIVLFQDGGFDAIRTQDVKELVVRPVED